MFRSRFLRLISLAFFLVVLHGCYAYRIEVPHPDPITEQESKMAHSLFWGLVLIPQTVVTENCKSNALAEVVTTTNLGYAFATVITLGVWAPLEFSWRCAEKPSSVGSDDGEI